MLIELERLAFKAATALDEIGAPGLRDRKNPCFEFLPGKSCGDCETDGHYLCGECLHRNPDGAPDFFATRLSRTLR